MIRGHEDRFREGGFVTRDWEMHLLARRMDAGEALPDVDPARLVLADAPEHIEPPRW
jgi:hypothetical protein